MWTKINTRRPKYIYRRIKSYRLTRITFPTEDGDDENLDRGVYACPSWNAAEEEGDKLVGEETLPWVPKMPGQ
jgi:hypothetical protein